MKKRFRQRSTNSMRRNKEPADNNPLLKGHLKWLDDWVERSSELPEEEFLKLIDNFFPFTPLERCGIKKALKIAKEKGSIRAGDVIKLFHLGGNPNGTMQ